MIFGNCTLIIQPYQTNDLPPKKPPRTVKKPKYPPSKKPSQKTKGFTYTVSRGDTLWSISRDYKVDIDKLARINNIKDASFIREGQKLFIPGSKPKKYSGKKPSLKPSIKPTTPVKPSPNIKPSSKRFSFYWPLKNSGRKKVTSNFGKRIDPILNVTTMHTGIDIDADLGDPVLASASGVVAFSGTMRGYGNLIIIKHPDNWHTVYAHLNKISVHKDQKVNQGQKIGEAGKTGIATGVHLHFEIRQGKESRNPLLFLP